MTPRKFFVGRTVGLILLSVVLAVVFIYRNNFSSVPAENEDMTTEQTQQPEENTTPAKPAVFAWRFTEANTLNLDGNPNTNVYLSATYTNGETEEKLIDTTAGSCNEIPDMAEDIAHNSTMIQCYAAGLGYYFKVTEAENGYRVERKTFEEATPDYEPPAYLYEVIAEFSL